MRDRIAVNSEKRPCASVGRLAVVILRESSEHNILYGKTSSDRSGAIMRLFMISNLTNVSFLRRLNGNLKNNIYIFTDGGV